MTVHNYRSTTTRMERTRVALRTSRPFKMVLETSHHRKASTLFWNRRVNPPPTPLHEPSMSP